MFACLYVVICYLVAKTFIHANSVRKIIISIHVSLQLPKITYGGENTSPLPYTGCLGLSPAILSQFTVEMCAAAKNCEIFNKIPFLGVQGCSRSLMLTNLKSPSPVLVLLCSKSVPTCNRFFHTIKDNSGIITSFYCLMPSFEGNPLTHRHKILSR